jgi:hypothetical protein
MIAFTESASEPLFHAGSQLGLGFFANLSMSKHSIDGRHRWMVAFDDAGADALLLLQLE